MTANQIAYWNYVESNRHNLATEKEQGRSNLAREKETHRANLAQEALGGERNRLQAQANTINAFYRSAELAEQNRHNMATEQYQIKSSENEQKRINLGYAQIASNERIASANVGLGYSQLGATYASISETQRANIARETEINRSNIVNENQQARNTSVARINAAANTKQALARQQQVALEATKWNEDLSRATRQAQYNQTVSNSNLINSQINLNQQRITESRFDMVNKAANTVIRALDSGARLLGGKK